MATLGVAMGSKLLLLMLIYYCVALLSCVAGNQVCTIIPFPSSHTDRTLTTLLVLHVTFRQPSLSCTRSLVILYSSCRKQKMSRYHSLWWYLSWVRDVNGDAQHVHNWQLNHCLTIVDIMFCRCTGASSSFMSPFSYQTNLMVWSAGKYKFADYPKFGGPMTILAGIVTGVTVTYLLPITHPDN